MSTNRMNVTLWKVWSGAISVAVVALLTELIPVVFGTSEEAKVDWRPVYFVLRFVLLPVLSLALALYIAVGVLLPTNPRERLLFVAALVIPAGYLVLLWVYPAPLFVRL